MAVVQISRIQHRRGLATDLPQLAAGELGWVIDEQRLFIGNGKVSDGAPAVGNTEVITANTTGFSTIVNHIYKGYKNDGTIVTGANANDPVKRTLQARLDDYVSVKSFGAKGDFNTSTLTGTDDTQFLQKAINQLYVNSDKTDERSRRVLLLPAGVYKVTGTIYLPPYTHLVGEGADRTFIRMTSGTSAVLQTVDNSGDGSSTWTGNVYPNLGASGAVLPKGITIEGLTVHNSTDYAGINLDSCTEVKFLNTNFKGNHAFTDADVSNADSTNTIGKGIAVRSTTANTTSNITFQNCKIEKFSRLVDVSYDSDTFVFTNCIFSDARFGLMAGEVTDGSTAGLTVGPKNIQILNSNFNKIFSSAIKVAAVDSINNVISSNNYFENTVGKNAGGNSSINVDPVIDFGTDQCSTDNDFFESNLTRPTTLPAQPLLDGVGSLQSSIRKITLSDNQSNIDTGIMFQALNSKKIEIDYKISRGSNVRIGTFTINPVYVNDSTTSVVHNDDYMEDDDIGLTLTPIYEDNDSTAGSESLTLQYTSTSTGEDLTMEYQIKSLV